MPLLMLFFHDKVNGNLGNEGIKHLTKSYWPNLIKLWICILHLLFSKQQNKC